MMKPTVIALFAHPDDEAFGPGGTIAKLSKEYTSYLVCVTNGDSKNGSRKHEIALGKLRKKELLASAKLLGIKKVFFLGYRDGSLNNNIYHEIADKLKALLEQLQPELLLTFEPRGVSGHTDHIVVSNITSFLFHKLPFVKSAWYYCLHEDQRNTQGHDYFIFMPQGYADVEIQKKVDVSDVWDIKLQAMFCHVSQKHDCDRILMRQKYLPRVEYFLELKK